MKKILALVLVLLSLAGTVYADTVDLSGMTYEELVALKAQINLAIWNSKEWQEVKVPQGVWKVGEDIPAGHWTIKMREDSNSFMCAITYCDTLDNSGLGGSMYGNLCEYIGLSKPGAFDSYPTQIDIVLKDSTYIIIEGSDAVFTPFSGKPDLGFK